MTEAEAIEAMIEKEYAKGEEIEAEVKERVEKELAEILDKISAEIKENMSWEMYDEYGNETALCKELMEIIEKYKKEGAE